MKRLTVCCSNLRTLLIALGILLFGSAAGTAAFAQRGGGHFGGGVRVGPPAAPRVMPRPGIPPAVRMRTVRLAPIVRPTLLPALGSRSILGGRSLLPASLAAQTAAMNGTMLPPGPITSVLERPFRTSRPIFILPIVGFQPFGAFGFPFGYGLGFGFNSLWPGCDFYSSWQYGCGGWAPYAYAPPEYNYQYAPSVVEPEIEVPSPPLYTYSGGLRYVQLYLKDSTVYNVTDYWVVNGQLHFKTLEDNGTRVVEHTIDFDQLDLQKTIDVNSQAGFRFVLRDEPIEQYLRDHASEATPAPNVTPDQTTPTPPPQAAPPAPAPPTPPPAPLTPPAPTPPQP